MEFCIPHFGSRALLLATLQGVLATCPEAKVLIGDDSRALKARDLSPFKNVQIFPGPKKGFAANANQLIKKCQGEWVVLINNDLILDQDWWPEMSRVITKAKPETFSLASTIMNGQGLIDSLGDAYSWFGQGYNRYHYKTPHSDFFRRAKVLGPTGALMVVRRPVFNLLGGFDEQFQSYCEDVDFNLRANAAGFVSDYIPQAKAVHFGSSTFSGESKQYYSARNTLLLIRKNFIGRTRDVLLRRARLLWWWKYWNRRQFRSVIRRGIREGMTLKLQHTGAMLAAIPTHLQDSFWANIRRRFRIKNGCY